jgi:hypothetical protein
MAIDLVSSKAFLFGLQTARFSLYPYMSFLPVHTSESKFHVLMMKTTHIGLALP